MYKGVAVMRQEQLAEAYEYCRRLHQRASVPLQTRLVAVPHYWLMQQMEIRAKG